MEVWVVIDGYVTVWLLHFLRSQRFFCISDRSCSYHGICNIVYNLGPTFLRFTSNFDGALSYSLCIRSPRQSRPGMGEVSGVGIMYEQGRFPHAGRGSSLTQRLWWFRNHKMIVHVHITDWEIHGWDNDSELGMNGVHLQGWWKMGELHGMNPERSISVQ
jgi:hypothetical protein